MRRDGGFPLRVVPILTAAVFLLVTTATSVAQTFTKLHEFSADRGTPQAGLAEDSNGVLWGTTSYGGAYGRGSIYTLTPDGLGGFTYAERHSFAGSDGAGPLSALVQAADGRLYGLAQGDGNSLNRIYRIDSDGNNFEVVYELTAAEGSGSRAALIQGSDGLLYGTAPYDGAYDHGTVFSFDPSTSALTVLHDFTLGGGALPMGALLEGADGRLYGTAQAGGSGFQHANGNAVYQGVVYRLDKSGANFVVLRSFTGADGAAPQSELIQLADGFLYGTTLSSSDFRGLVFKLDTGGHNFQVLHHFTVAEGAYPYGGLVKATDGLLYGTATTSTQTDDGVVFRMSATGASFEIVHSFVNAEGIAPIATLRKDSGGFLYGTLQYDGAGGYGAAFQLNTVTNNVAIVHAFASRDTFWSLSALLAGPGGWFYGVAGPGGSYGGGVVFRTDASGGSYSILHSFGGVEGISPVGPVIIGADGFLYGTTHGDFGDTGYGTVWRMATDGTSFSVLHAFDGTDGDAPFSGVTQGADGYLYGTTTSGGLQDQGVIYRLSTSGQIFSVLHDSTAPLIAPLLQAADGKLYGTAYYGGTHTSGSVYRLDTSGANFEEVHSFDGSDGYGPYGGLIQLADGKLYGVTFRGTPNEMGVVYKLDPSGSNFSVIHVFSGTEGKFSEAPLLAATDGFLYGATDQGGTAGLGTIFRLDSAGASFSIVYNFGGADGASARAGLVEGSDGALYGTTRDGGTFNGGVIFRLDPGSSPGRRPRLVGR